MSLQCLNGGQFRLNSTTNETYCLCDPCHQGVHCDYRIPNKGQIQFNTDYVYLIIYLIELCLSLANNLLSLALFQGSKCIRRTNIGVYLAIYSFTSITGSVVLVVGQSVKYFRPYPFANNNELTETFHCFLEKSGQKITSFLCIWLSALVAFERALIICFNFKMNARRWRSVFMPLFVFCITAATSIPMLGYQCAWDKSHKTSRKRIATGWFYTVGILAGVVYCLATLLVLISFALRIYYYGTAQMSRTKIFFKLLRKHLFIFIPPTVYLLCVIPYQIWFAHKRHTQRYFQCGISTVEYILKVIVESLPNIPTVLIWLIFVYPSNVYMTEFYTETWIGRIWMRQGCR